MLKHDTGGSLDHTTDILSCSSEGIALGGYDVVSYRQESGPILGENQHSVEHDDEIYLFFSAENRTLFLQEPDRYLPAYSGFCAITMALGKVTCPNFTNFKIEDGRLLLFEVAGFTNGRTIWDSNPITYRKQADINFEVLSNHK
jgi:hypothetical protein